MKKLILLTLFVSSIAVAQAPAGTSPQSVRDLTNLGLAPRVAEALGTPYTADLPFATGKTLSIQEATAASACSGTATCNGATDVVTSTTCATTGSRIFLQRSSADTDGVGQMYVKSISTGVSFTVNCVTASDTSTFNWLIIHEAP